MEKILNWGLLSTARINRALIPILHASKRTRLLAVASRDISTAEAYAREWKIPRAYGSYEALLQDPEIDVIYNPLPNHLHAEWSIKAMRANKHVMCEKPFALSVEEADAMAQTSKETGMVLAEAFMYRHHPQTKKVKEMAQSGVLGKIQLIKGGFSFTLSREGNFRNFKEYGGGSLWDVGCYPISYARMILGAEPVEAFGWQVTGPGGSDVSFCGQMKFPNDVFFQFDSSFINPFRAYMEIIGSKASLYIPEPFKPGKSTELFLRNEQGEQRVKIKGEDLYLGEIMDMCDAVSGKKAPEITLEDSRGTLAAILALLRSVEGNQVIFV